MKGLFILSLTIVSFSFANETLTQEVAEPSVELNADATATLKKILPEEVIAQVEETVETEA